jgi:PST family polysaccharide transporter
VAEKHKTLVARIIANSSWLFLEKGFKVISTLVVGLWMVRYLGAEQYGKYSFAFSVITISSIFFRLGLDAVLVKELKNRPEKKLELIGSCVLVKMVGALIALAIAVGLGFWSSEGDRIIIILVAVMGLSFCFRWSETIDVWFQSSLNARYVVKVRTVAMTVSALTKVGLILSEAPLVYFGAIVTLEAAIAAILVLWTYAGQGNSLREWRVDRQLIRSLLSESWPLMFTTLGGILYSQLDKILLGSNVGMAQVGVYAMYLQLMMVPRMLISSLNLSVNPILVETFESDEKRYWLRLEQALSLNSWIALMAGIGIILLGTPTIRLILGNEFVFPSIWLSVLIAITHFMESPGTLRVEYLIIRKKSKLVFGFRIMSLTLNLILNFTLIPRYGVLGAALAGALTILFFDCISSFFSSYTRQYARTYFQAIGNALLQRPLLMMISKIPRFSRAASSRES